MQIDLRTVSITPLRQTFNHIAERQGADKAASRYVEATMDVQAMANYHYRPTWDPDHLIFDSGRTALKMKDWYVFKDPRQLYYGTYTMARSRMQETAEADFDFVEDRGLASNYPSEARQLALDVYVPLRHVAWGANQNNAYICAYGYGTAITQPSLFQGMDQLGIAQYLTRLGLMLGGTESLDAAKAAWMDAPAWQAMRRYVEDTMVLRDWFELWVAQNVVLDGMLFPLMYQHVDNALTAKAGPVVSMLTRFQNEWFTDSSKWVDAVMKAAAAESDDNKALLSGWVAKWGARAQEAVAPLAKIALGDQANDVMAEIADQFKARLAKAGVAA